MKEKQKDMAEEKQLSSKLWESDLYFKSRYEVTLSGKQTIELVQMADAVHCLV